MGNELLEAAGIAVVVLSFLIGLLGLVVPILPGMLLIWAGIAFYAFSLDDFMRLAWYEFAFLTILALIFGTADLWLPMLGASKTGASWKTLVLGAVGAIIGTFVVPLIGTIIGYVVGIVLAEYLRHRALKPALKASVGGVVGWGLGTVVQLAGGIAIIVLFGRLIN